MPLDAWGTDHAPVLAGIVAKHGGLLDRLFTLAKERALDIGLHVDEAAEAGALPYVARATVRHGCESRVTCGHC